MKQNTPFLILTLGVAALLAGCSTQSPTAPKTPGPPKPGTPTTGLSVTLTATPNPASVGEVVLVVAQVNSGSGNAPDGTAVTFLVSGGVFPVGLDAQGNVITATNVVRTTSGGHATVDVTSAVAGQITVEARVAGGNAFKTISFQTVVGPTPTPKPGVTITSVSPNQGAPEGGDRVVIFGSGFVQPLTVKFVVAGQEFPATVNFVAPDGRTMTVTTPRVVSTPPATQNQVADVVVTSGAYSDTLTGGFTFLAQVTTPQIYVLTPNAGPFEGGTKVVIAGVGFQYPVQVLFGDRQAQVTSSNYTEVDCIAPSITPSQPGDATTVQVTVTNTLNGQVSNGVSYRYGEAMFISGITPTEGPADAATIVTIFGQGFVAPVSVTIGGVAGVTSWDVLSVSGTEISARAIPVPEGVRSCSDAGASITVTNLGSNTKAAASQSFTYRAVRPLITSVDFGSAGNNQVQQYLPGTCNIGWSSHTVTVHGSGFQQGMTVSFGAVGPVLATFVDAHTLTLALPDLTSIPIQTVTCNDGLGQGTRNVATAVAVTVNNSANTCSDTLNGAIVINPCVQTCAITATPTPTPTPAPVMRILTLNRNVNAPGDGTITANPGSFVCPTTCAPTFGDLVNVSLTAAVTTGTFGGWTDDCSACGTLLTCSVLMDADKVCTATFNP